MKKILTTLCATALLTAAQAQTIDITYSGTTASVSVPLEAEGVTYKVSGANVSILVADDVATADNETPISVFTSFYSDNPDRIVNLGVCCKFISKVLQPGETMNFNNEVSPFSAANGYKLAPVLKDGETKMGYGGGSCQVSSTLWDTLMQLPGITVLRRNPHGANAASYLPHGMDAASGTNTQNFIFRNDFDFPIRIDASTHDLALFVAIYKETT